MNKIFFLFLMLILFCSCDNTVTLSKLCLYSDVFVSIGTNEVTRQKSDSIVVDRHSNKIWFAKHTERKIVMKDFYEPEVCIELNFEDGILNYLYEDFLFNGKYVSRAFIGENQKLLVFDISSGLYRTIEIDDSYYFRICGLDENCIYLYMYDDNSIHKINYQTLEQEKIHSDLHNPGYCVESKSFIGINEKNNICILKDGVISEFPIKGIRYKNNRYVDVSNLYYFTNDKIYYVKKDSVGYIKGIFSLAIFFPGGLEPVKWYCYDRNTNKSIKLNNKGYSFLCDFE